MSAAASFPVDGGHEDQDDRVILVRGLPAVLYRLVEKSLLLLCMGRARPVKEALRIVSQPLSICKRSVFVDSEHFSACDFGYRASLRLRAHQHQHNSNPSHLTSSQANSPTLTAQAGFVNRASGEAAA